jgi:hypothetical protein
MSSVLMVFLLGCGCGQRQRGAGSHGGATELALHGAVDGLEPASLGRRQIRRQGEGAELAQSLPEASQGELQGCGAGRQRLRGTPRRERGQRIVEHQTPVGRICHAVCGHQRKGLRRGELVAFDGGEHDALLIVREHGQRFRDGRPDDAVADRGAGLLP